ncbi:molybdate ABC transporter substrate-binding protein [Candidatus Thiosymbion oneisti]|uniref:molybdate ABC transporter substrate-binding protein n=1 Tax=Candidatus Thiosymbion oneisti TaxID=589554 RepID=UPI000A443BDF|nr:molybdate ABC transporter substrate-binding protein [Candidatus Thiosymbion oneisti]
MWANQPFPMKNTPITEPGLRILRVLLVAMLVLLIAASPALAQKVRIAVAANFTAAAKEIGVLFAQATGHEASYSFGSTGQLYAQITQGAPFEVFLAADQVRPAQAVAAGLAVADSRFTYATGRLVLFSRDESLVTDETTLHNPGITKVAITNPVTAPYGAAAVAVMKALGVYVGLAPRLVRGNNIGQTYQFVATGNAEVGFVALSQVARHNKGSRWPVPDHLHPPLAQDAVLLRRGADNRAAHGFLAFLKGPAAAAVKMRYGYGGGN